MLKILIVEDEEIIRRGLVYTIDWLAMNCMIAGDAANGKEGLRLLKQIRPDLVITDLIMPEMGGIEMLEAAVAHEMHFFKSIILTSYADFEYARQAVKLQVADYLLKPVDEEELQRAVERIQAQFTAENTEWTTTFELPQAHNPYVMQTLGKIRAQYQDKINIECIADELQVSASYLSRKFKEETTQTFLDSLTRYRIQQAIALLRQGTYRVYEVSHLVGFSDYKHFCTVFKKYTHLSPREFVKQTGQK